MRRPREEAPSRLLFADALRLGAHGLSTRRARAALSALGVAIGVAAMVAVLGVAESAARACSTSWTGSAPIC